MLRGNDKTLPMKLIATVLLLAALGLLAACGFSPVYADKDHRDNVALAAFDQVEIDNIPDRDGQRLRNLLLDRMYRDGRPGNARYTLEIKELIERRFDLDVTKSADSTRGQLRLATTLRLVDKQTGQRVLERELLSITSYNILGSEFTNRVAEDNARQNALEDLARQVETQLSLYFRSDK